MVVNKCFDYIGEDDVVYSLSLVRFLPAKRIPNNLEKMAWFHFNDDPIKHEKYKFGGMNDFPAPSEEEEKDRDCTTDWDAMINKIAKQYKDDEDIQKLKKVLGKFKISKEEYIENPSRRYIRKYNKKKIHCRNMWLHLETSLGGAHFLIAGGYLHGAAVGFKPWVEHFRPYRKR